MTFHKDDPFQQAKLYAERLIAGKPLLSLFDGMQPKAVAYQIITMATMVEQSVVRDAVNHALYKAAMAGMPAIEVDGVTYQFVPPSERK